MGESKEVALIKSWRLSPRKFVIEALKIEEKGHFITAQQEEGLEELRKLVSAKLYKADGWVLTEEQAIYAKKVGISIQSGRGTGKDAMTGWCILWFLFCFEKSLVPCTAPTAHQLRDVLWREIAKWLKGSAVEEHFVLQTDRLSFKESGGKEWFAVARTANPKSSQDEQEETLSGFHEEYMMIAVDEGSGVPDAVFRPLEGTLTQKVNFILLIFNPTRGSGFAIDSQTKDRGQWVCLHWDAEKSEIVTKDSIENKAKKYGRDSNFFRVNVSGLPPKSDPDILIPWEWVMDAVGRELEPLDTDQDVFGFDVGAGGDKSFICHRTGPVIHPFIENDTSDSEVLTGWAMRNIFEKEPKFVMIDKIGVGWGIAGNLRVRTQTEIIDVVVSEAAPNDDRFERLRDELWWRVRGLFERREISIPNDSEFIAELTTIKYDEKTNGKIKVESKKDMKKRGLQSPNKSDSLCFTEYFASEEIRRMARPKSTARVTRGVTWKTV